MITIYGYNSKGEKVPVAKYPRIVDIEASEVYEMDRDLMDLENFRKELIQLLEKYDYNKFIGSSSRVIAQSVIEFLITLSGFSNRQKVSKDD